MNQMNRNEWSETAAELIHNKAKFEILEIEIYAFALHACLAIFILVA